MTAKYQFRRSDEPKLRFLICPQCGESLTSTDIEIYPACPYCDVILERNQELEDFILQPLVERWASQYSPMTGRNLPQRFRGFSG
jgi:Zn-finger nucleic acid-binding protein